MIINKHKNDGDKKSTPQNLSIKKAARPQTARKHTDAKSPTATSKKVDFKAARYINENQSDVKIMSA